MSVLTLKADDGTEITVRPDGVGWELNCPACPLALFEVHNEAYAVVIADERRDRHNAEFAKR